MAGDASATNAVSLIVGQTSVLTSVAAAGGVLPWNMTPTAAQYLLSAVAQSAAAILAIVLTLSFAFAQVTPYPLPWRFLVTPRPRQLVALLLVLLALIAPLAVLAMEQYAVAWLSLPLLLAGVIAVAVGLRGRVELRELLEAIRRNPRRYAELAPDVSRIVRLAGERGDAFTYRSALESLWLLDGVDDRHAWVRDVVAHDWRHAEQFGWFCEVALSAASPIGRSESRRGSYERVQVDGKTILSLPQTQGSQSEREADVVNEGFGSRFMDLDVSLRGLLRGDMSGQWEQCFSAIRLLLSLALDSYGARSLAQEAKEPKLAQLKSADTQAMRVLALLREVYRVAPVREERGDILVATMINWTREKNDNFALESELEKRGLVDDLTAAVNRGAADFTGRAWARVVDQLAGDPYWDGIVLWPTYSGDETTCGEFVWEPREHS